jgi:GT2 family glycosyltransferase
MTAPCDVSVVIPTYGRDQVLVDTIRFVRELTPPPAELIVVDQSLSHVETVAATLADWDRRGEIRWLRLEAPSIPRAMNRGLLAATRPLVLFLDDDVVPDPALVEEHWQAHKRLGGVLVAGRVLQPWDDGLSKGGSPFASDAPAEVFDFMGGNFSVPRELALAAGGMDENFVGAAYRFEADFARRFRGSGRKIHFWPAATIRHLKAGTGGTRTAGGHEGGFRPQHGVGEYYHLLRSRSLGRAFVGALGRMWRTVPTRHHLRRPWTMPLTLLGELVALVWAIDLARRGPRLLCPAMAGAAAR